jgi:DNA-binding beta-propeller fold protein YncE
MPSRRSTPVLVLSIVACVPFACRSHDAGDLSSRLYVALGPTLNHQTPDPFRVFDADPVSGALSSAHVQVDLGNEYLVRPQLFQHSSEKYLVVGRVGTFLMFARDEDGNLKLLPKEATVHSGALHGAGVIRQHPEKGYFYVFNRASYGNLSGMFVLRVGDGETTPFFEMVRMAEEPGCDGLAAALSPDGKVLYCSTDYGKSVLVLDANEASGPFTRAATIPVADRMRELVADPSGERLYVLSGTTIPSSERWNPTWIAAYRRTTLPGRLTAVTRGVTTIHSWVAEMAITPDGRYLYALDAILGQVLGFAIESDGTLRQIGGARAGRLPSVLAVDGTSRFVYVGNQESEDLSLFTIGPGGELVPMAGSPVPLEGSPVALSLLPSS